MIECSRFLQQVRLWLVEMAWKDLLHWTPGGKNVEGRISHREGVVVAVGKEARNLSPRHPSEFHACGRLSVMSIPQGRDKRGRL